MGKNSEDSGVLSPQQREEEEDESNYKRVLCKSPKESAKDMDEITQGMRGCSLEPNKQRNGRDILVSDNLTPRVGKQDGKLDKCVDRLQNLKVSRGAQESDERIEAISTIERHDEPEVVGTVEGQDEVPKMTDSEESDTKREALVKLDRPSQDDNEDDEASTDEDGNNEFVERGPVGGVASDYRYTQQYNNMGGYNNQANQTGMQMPAMPANFPNYNSYNPSYNNSIAVNMNEGNKSMGGKRTVEESHLQHEEPLKFNRPQQCNAMNNLNNPGVQAVSNVYQKQMSGGTVFTAEDPSSQTDFDNVHKSLLQQQESFDFDKIVNNLGESEFEAVLQAVENEDTSQVSFRSTQQQSSSLPSFGTFVGVAPSASLAKVELPDELLFEESLNTIATDGSKRSSSSSSADDFGYQDALSPQTPHDPMSVGTLRGSSPQLVTGNTRSPAPPPSVDSGLGSPMSEDGKSPNHMYSPPHEAVPSNRQTPAPPHQTHWQTISSPVQDPVANMVSPRHVSTFSPPQVASPASRQMVTPAPGHPSQWQTIPSPIQNKLEPDPIHSVQQSSPFIYDFPSGVGHADNLQINNYGSNVRNIPIPHKNITKGPVNPNLHTQMSLMTVSAANQSCRANVTNICFENRDEELYHALCVISKDVDEMECGQKGPNRQDHAADKSRAVAAILQDLQDIPEGAITTARLKSSNTPTEAGISPQVTPTAKVPANMPTTVPPTIGHGCVMPATVHLQQPQGTNGKIALPKLPLRKQQQPQQSPPTSMLVLQPGNKVFIPVQPIPYQQQKPRFQYILPKTGPQPTLTSAPSCGNNVMVSNIPSNQNIAPNPGPIPRTQETGNVTLSTTIVSKNVININNSPNKGPNQGLPNQMGTCRGLRGNVLDTFPEQLVNNARRFIASKTMEEITKGDEEGDTSLHYSAMKDKGPLLVAILERLEREQSLSSINIKNHEGETALFTAAVMTYSPLVKLLIEYDADVNIMARSKQPSGEIEHVAAIHCVAGEGEQALDTLNALLSSPTIEVDKVDSNGQTALLRAIHSHGKVTREGVKINSIPVMRALLASGADPNLQVQQNGKTALMYALETMDLELIEKMFITVTPSKLATYLKTKAGDGRTCQKIAQSIKSSLDVTSQHRLTECLKLAQTSSNRFNHQSSQ